MALNGIDISSYQAGLNPAAMRGTDFIIIKVSQGTGYVNPTWRRQADATLRSGRLLGLYHYISGGNPQAEARYFVNQIRPYIGRAVLALDWESGENRAWGNTAYLQSVTSEVIRLTGVRPLLYGSASVYRQLADVGRRLNCGLWVAQYASMNPTGWQAHPWNESAYSCAIRQYSSAGRIPGWGANLDLDLFYGDRRAWNAYARTSIIAKIKPAVRKDNTMPSAADVWNYKIGHNGKAHNGDMPTWYFLSCTHMDTYNTMREVTRRDDGGTKDKTTGSLYSRVCYIDMRVRQLYPVIQQMASTISQLSKQVGQLSSQLAAVKAGVPTNVTGTFQVKEANSGSTK